jgi:hypothetical protein
MNTTNIVTVRPADVFPRSESSTPERLMHRVTKETLCEMAFIAVTVSMATFLSYICWHALQNYRVL